MKLLKTSVSIVLTLCMVVSIFVVAPLSGAQAVTNVNWTYVFLEDGTVEITGCSPVPTNMVIPSYIDKFKVTRIADRAFWNDDIETLVIPNGITNIGEDCFGNITNLRSVEFQTTGTITVDSNAFDGCEITDIKFPKKGYLNIYSTAFDNVKMDTLVLPKTVVYIGYDAFRNSAVKDFYIENPNCYISDYNGIPFPNGAVLHADYDSGAHEFANFYSDKLSYELYDTHNNTTATVLKPATTKSDGKYVLTCDYCGKKTENKINKIKSVNLSTTTYSYNGKQKNPAVKAIDSAGQKISSQYYTATYPKSRTKAGKYTVSIKFKDRYSGTVKRTFKINKIRLTSKSIKLKKLVYKGKATYPSVRYKGKKLKLGRDYTIKSIKKYKSIGTASATLKFIGNYSGTAKASYSIVPAKVKGIKLKSRSERTVTFKWNKVKGVTGYKVYRYDHNTYKYKLYKSTRSNSMKVPKLTKGLSRDYGYVIITVRAYKKVGKKIYQSAESENYGNCVKPRAPTYKVTCPDFGVMRILYKNLEYATTYVQIQVCIDKSFNNREYNVRNMFVTINRASDYDRYDLSNGIIRDEKYYVRCRQYLYSDSMNPVYSKWGKKKKIYVR